MIDGHAVYFGGSSYSKLFFEWLPSFQYKIFGGMAAYDA